MKSEIQHREISCEECRRLYDKWNADIGKRFSGHALTEKYVSEIVKAIWAFVLNNDLKHLFNDLYLREYINVNGKITKHALVVNVNQQYEELNVRQLEALGYRVLWNMKFSV